MNFLSDIWGYYYLLRTWHLPTKLFALSRSKNYIWNSFHLWSFEKVLEVFVQLDQRFIVFSTFEMTRNWTFWAIYEVIFICWGHYTYLPNCLPYQDLNITFKIVFIFEVFKKFLRFSFDWIQDLLFFLHLKCLEE